jgi:hypothetical protein
MLKHILYINKLVNIYITKTKINKKLSRHIKHIFKEAKEIEKQS